MNELQRELINELENSVLITYEKKKERQKKRLFLLQLDIKKQIEDIIELEKIILQIREKGFASLNDSK